jgi:hypothetical protein
MAPVHRTFTPGPVPLDWLTVAVLRRRQESISVPYAFLILACGNETFQVMLPSPEHDQTPDGKSSSLPPFPSTPTAHGAQSHHSIDLSGQELVVGDSVSVDMTFQEVKETTPSTRQAVSE